MAHVWRTLVIMLLVLVALIPLHSGGTVDVSSWLGWIEGIKRDGLILGYINGELIYPPLTWAILQGVAIASDMLNIEMFLALKWSLVFFLLLTSAIFLLWTRNLMLTALFHFSLVISSVGLGYLDIWLSPTILLAFWALKEKKLALFAIFFTISCLIKWQPAIMGPFLAVYLFMANDLSQWKTSLKVILGKVALPAGLTAAVIVLPFGPSVWAAFQNSMGHTGLTGNALNYNWVLTYYLHLTQPDRFGAITDGMIHYIDILDWAPADWMIPGISRILFAFFYLSALAVFIKRLKSFYDLLRFTIIGYLAYVTFNIGVHENHFYLAAFLMFVVCWINPADRYITMILAFIANINLFMFYGINGGFPYNRLIGMMDITLPLALFNVIFFVLLWASACFSKSAKPNQPAFS